VIVVVEPGARYAISAEIYKPEVTRGHGSAFGEVPSIAYGGADLPRLITGSAVLINRSLASECLR